VSLEDETKELVIAVLQGVLLFSIIVLVPFLLSGTWPPFVSILSNSMEPNIDTGDMVFVIDEDRDYNESMYAGVDTIHGKGDKSFNEYGDVIIYYPNGDTNKIPVIHRAAFHVDKGEDWTTKAYEISHPTRDCSVIRNCPAPHEGLITLGDNNPKYDQNMGVSTPVKEDWIISKAEYRIPNFGHIRNILY